MQTEVNDYIQQFKTGYFSPLGQMTRLTEEVGKLTCEVSHYYGEKQEKTDEKSKTVSKEPGDVFFILVSVANSLEIDLTEVSGENMAKSNKRGRYRFERRDEKTHD